MNECKLLVGGGSEDDASGGRGAAGGGRGADGGAVQVDPIKLTLKAPVTKLLKLKCDDPLSNFAFNFNLRRYTTVSAGVAAVRRKRWTV
jgi:hypothetical protein